MSAKNKATNVNQSDLVEVIILAAGLGTRMKSDLPKVMHPVAGAPLLQHVVNQILNGINHIDQINFVVGHGKEVVESFVRSEKNGFLFADLKSVITHQKEQLGTGHAVQCALENSNSKAPFVAIFNGDLPLLHCGMLYEFLEFHKKTKSFATLISAILDDPSAYGRIIRKGNKFIGVVEHKDANEKQKKINEINGGVYLFDRSLLVEALSKVNNKNKTGEYYLPDVFSYALKKKKKIEAYICEDPDLIRGVNTMKELAEAQKIYFQRNANYWMSQGVFIHDPEKTWIGSDVTLDRGVVIHPFTAISGISKINKNVTIGSFCQIHNTQIESGSIIKNNVILEDSIIGKDCSVGPMAHFRPGSKILNSVKIGNFVELKNSTIGSNTSASHLSYIGDAEIGSNTNIGCGFVTCNFDGTVKNGSRKHKSIIGNEVFMGSDCQVVAPIEIADGTYIASGSTVTKSVIEKDSLVFARARQVTKPGYAKKYKR